MSDTPTFATPSTFLGLPRSEHARIGVAGVPLDLGTTNRGGARFGPHAIRSASRMLIDGDHPARWRSPFALSIADAGDLGIALGDLRESLAMIEEQARRFEHLIALGGDHSITLPLLRALNARTGPLGVVHFDAHVDTWPDSFGQPFGHGSPFFHAIEEKLIDPARMAQIGVRSPVARAVHDWTAAQGVLTLPAMTVHERGPAAVAAEVASKVRGGPVYLTFDIDALDPAFAPGTGTPEIGGLATWQAQAILRGLSGLQFVGMDVVEVSPAYDHAEITALAAASMVWEYLALLEP